jgi:hypothetical protein
MSYKVEKLMEAQYHFNLMEDAKTEEHQFWESLRHERAMKCLSDKEQNYESLKNGMKQEFQQSMGG